MSSASAVDTLWYDHDTPLHMMSRPQPVLTRRVGYEANVSPRHAIRDPLAAVGHTRLPASLLNAHDGLHLHPAVVAAATQATCELVAARVGATAPCRDEELFEKLARGRRALGAPDAVWTEMALERLQWIAGHVRQLIGGTRLHGLVRWVAYHGVTDERYPHDDNAVRAVMVHLLLGYSSPPINTLRRAPSLEYYRATGSLVVRNFGQFDVDPMEGR